MNEYDRDNEEESGSHWVIENEARIAVQGWFGHWTIVD